MTKKDYKLIARALALTTVTPGPNNTLPLNNGKLRLVADCFVTILTSDNPKFNAKKFYDYLQGIL